MNKPIDRMRKILEMAEHGTHHEAKIARSKLNNLLYEHGLTISDLISEKKHVYWFNFKYTEEKEVIFGIYGYIMCADSVSFFKGKKRIGFEFTVAEYIRFKEYVDVYQAAFRNELSAMKKNMTSAFIYKHRLFNPMDTKPDTKNRSCSTPPEVIERIAAMMQTLDEIDRPTPRIEQL